MKHKSYAMMSFSRVSHGGAASLFGSSIEHTNTIRMAVKPAEVDRHLNRDWFYATGVPYVEVEMSYSQFAEAISAMNVGEGVPVTLTYLNGEQIEDCPFTNKRMEFEAEFKDSLRDLTNKLNTITEQTEAILNGKKPLNKSDKETILAELNQIKNVIYDHIPFIEKSFNDQMDKTVLEAKGEVESFVMNKVISTGLEGLQKEMKFLENT